MSTNFDKFLLVLKRWTILEERLGRDFGVYLQDCAKSKNSNSTVFFADPSEDIKAIQSLLRLTENVYGNKYGYVHKTGASGLKLKDLEHILSDQFIEKFQKKIFKI